MIHELAYEDVRQQAVGRHPLRDHRVRERGDQERLPVGIFDLKLGLEHELVADSPVDEQLPGDDSNLVGHLRADLHVVGIILHAVGIDVILLYGKVAGEDRLAYFTLVSFDLDGLGVLLLHLPDFLVQLLLLRFRERRVEQGGLKDVGVKRKMLLAHRASEDLTAEPGVLGLKGGKCFLQLILLCGKGVAFRFQTGDLRFERRYFLVLFRHYPYLFLSIKVRKRCQICKNINNLFY